MVVSNGDIVRNMDNQNLAEIFCAIITQAIHKNYLQAKVDKTDNVWYNENIVKNVKDFLDEPYYNIGAKYE